MATIVKGLSERAQKHFDTFVSGANKQVPHPLDDERFFAFVRVCHLEKAALKETDVSEALVRAGFDEDLAKRLGSTYDDGRGILKPLTFSDVDK